MNDSLDIEALRASVADILAKECDREAVVRHVAAGCGPMQPLWATAAAMGWLALPIPPELGGLGLGLDALVPLYEELGRVAAPLPVLNTLLTVDAIARMAPHQTSA
ncbi:MAG: acyl-CoA dehydrogenase family protein, partial [Novosphingobium sp.]|nr:acyl-CoA dehydrogenase family protein [Novosphingobium sp.]